MPRTPYNLSIPAELFATLVLVRAGYQVVRTITPEVDDPNGVLAKLRAILGGDDDA